MSTSRALKILTIEELLSGKMPQIPLVDSSALNVVPGEKVGKQQKLPLAHSMPQVQGSRSVA
jgi:hypothetical protein